MFKQKLMQNTKRINFSVVLIIFGIICFFTIFLINLNSEMVLTQSLKNTGATAGPFTVDKDNSVYTIRIYQPMSREESSTVTGNVLNSKKEFLFGFEDELFYEECEDYEECETRKQWSFDNKITFPSKGNYYIDFKTEMSNPSNTNKLTVKIEKKPASTILFEFMGWISLIIGFYCFIHTLSRGEE